MSFAINWSTKFWVHTPRNDTNSLEHCPIPHCSEAKNGF